MKEFIKTLSEMNNLRYSKTMQELFMKKIPCGFFVGLDSEQFKVNNALVLKQNGLNLQHVIVLDDPNRAAIKCDGVPVITLKEFESLPEKPQWVLYINTNSEATLCEFFYRFNVKALQLGDSLGMERYCDFIYQHLGEIAEVYQLFKDEESRLTYLGMLKRRVSNQICYYRFAVEPQYWLAPFTVAEGDIAIDGGAYDGNTAIDFLKQGATVYSFEMDHKNYQKCLQLAEKYHFTAENLGLSSRESTASYVSQGSGSYMTSMGGGEVAKFIDLDTYVSRHDVPRIDYIKLDIEGAELDCLKGAAKSIIRWKPKMAVCAYHKPEDIWTLARYIKSLRSDYEFAFRHYSIGCGLFSETFINLRNRFNMNPRVPSDWEMVLYCK
ncbi:MAG: FkbM family methyltransferase [Selenomonadaceae bacterium]|nr:FkbM family methyltransferase [Selenomonadaceae bacterium]